jgi:hypothetical protein
MFVTLQVPAIFSLASANGPITAIVPDFLKAMRFHFLSNTKDCDAIFLASNLFAVVKFHFSSFLHHNIYKDPEIDLSHTSVQNKSYRIIYLFYTYFVFIQRFL